MREIKFRAWIPSQKIFSYFGLSACTLNDGALGKNEYKEAIITQFTGLLDKNGKEIYEGDIVQLPNAGICEIKYVETRFEAIPIEPNVLSYIYWSGEIIGNIYQNPQLLKESE